MTHRCSARSSTAGIRPRGRIVCSVSGRAIQVRRIEQMDNASGRLTVSRI